MCTLAMDGAAAKMVKADAGRGAMPRALNSGGLKKLAIFYNAEKILKKVDE